MITRNSIKDKGFIRTLLLISLAFLTALSLLPNSPASVQSISEVPEALQTSPTEPLVAIHVSEYTKSLNGSPQQPGLETDPKGWYYNTFYYFQIIGMLKEVLKSDGTPFVEVSDADIENGLLLQDGKPKYPIVFSLMSEAISDLEAQEIKKYVTAGGFVYSSGSAWTRTETGSWRNNGIGNAKFALGAEMGLDSSPTGPKPFGGSWSWGDVNYIRSTVNHRLVNHLPKNQDLFWPLPMNYDTDPFSLKSSTSNHKAWVTTTTSQNPATVLATIQAATGFSYRDFPLLTTTHFGNGNFIYQAEMASLAGWGGLAPGTFEYVFIRRAIEWAFEKKKIPIVRLATWPYPKGAAFQTRWDMDWYPGSLKSLVDTEAANGVRGQYYVTTSFVDDNGALLNWAKANGAIITSHSDVHVGPDAQSPADANNNILTSLNKLQSWMGERTSDWVSPNYQSIKDDSFQALVDNGIKAAGEQNFGPFPHFTLSMTTPEKHYDLLQLPTSEWVPNSATSSEDRVRMERISASSIVDAVDFYYDLGALINIYGHPYSSNVSLLDTYIKRAKSKQNVWFTNAIDVYNWWKQRDLVQVNPTYSYDADNNLGEVNVSVAGVTDPNIALDFAIPYWPDLNPSDIKVYKDGAETSDYEITPTGLKVKSGTATGIKVTYRYNSQPVVASKYVQTTKADFEAGALTNLDSATSVNDLILAKTDSNGSVTYFSDGFDDSSSLNNWQVKSGQWSVVNNVLEQSDTSPGYKNIYSGDPNWSNYSIEASTKFVSGKYGGEIAARLDPGSGARYALWIYPSTKTLKLAKFSSWTAYTQIGPTVSIPAIGNNWHKLKLELNGSNIKAYYDDVLYIDAYDTSYTKGAIGLETARSIVNFDNVEVIGPDSTYQSTGSLISQSLDGGNDLRDWKKISWTASTPLGTELKFRTRTAATEEDLATASWSSYTTANDSPITSPELRWIQFEVNFATTDPAYSPILSDVTLDFDRLIDLVAPLPPTNVTVVDPGTGNKLDLNWTNPTDLDFNHIHVYRSTVQGSLGDLIFENVSGTTLTDYTVQNGQTYYYTVRSVDNNGNESTNSEQYSGTSLGAPVINNALSFDPIDDYLVVPHNTSLNIPGAMTVEAFVNVSSFAGTYGVIASRWDGSTISWELYYNSAGKIYFYVRRPDNSGYVQAITTSGLITPGTWGHVAAVVDLVTGKLNVYYNGIRRASVTFSYSGSRLSTARLGINATADGKLIGDAVIDEVRISDSVRYSGTSYQIPMTSFVPDSNTIGLWHFNEEGPKAYDSSSNGNDADLMGDPLRVVGYNFD